MTTPIDFTPIPAAFASPTLVDVAQLTTLLRVQQAIAAIDTDIDAVMKLLVEGACKVLPEADGALIEMRDGHELVYRAVHGALQHSLGNRISIAKSLSGQALREGRSLYCRDVDADIRVDRAACHRLGIRSMLVVPITHRTKVIGVLKLYSSLPDAFSEQDLLIAQFFISAVAATFGNVAEAEAIAALRESEARFDRAMRGSNDGIWDWDIEAGRIFYSTRFKQLLGYADHEMGDHIDDWSRLLHPDDVQPTWNKVQDNFTKRIPYRAEYRLRTKGGEYLWFEATGQSEWNAEGKPVRMSGCLANISERKQLAQLKEEFVYTVTHELRTPLTALKGALDAMSLLHGKDLPETAQNMLDLAMTGSQRLMALINDLLDVGKMEAGKMQFDFENLSLSNVLGDAVSQARYYGEKYRVAYRFACDNQGAMVRADRGRLLQVMDNLLSNAAKFSPAGSIVEVSATTEKYRAIIRVKDSGKGIAPAFQEQIFAKFAQGQKGGGTGLGLNIVKTIVERMQGSVAFETTPDSGTTFIVELPLSAN